MISLPGRRYPADIPCRSNPDMWGDADAKATADIQRAITLCNQCPAKAQCAAEALTIPKTNRLGTIWAGHHLPATKSRSSAAVA